MLHLFALGIMDFGELRSIANTLQERRFTGVRSADDENSEMNIFEVLSNFHRIQLDGPFFCDMTSVLVAHGQVLQHYHYSPCLLNGRADKSLRIASWAILAETGLMWYCRKKELLLKWTQTVVVVREREGIAPWARRQYIISERLSVGMDNLPAT